MNYVLRKYLDDDYEFVYKVKKDAYKKYVEHYWGKWNDVEQRNRFKEAIEKTFNRTYIIMLNNKRIGFYQGHLVNERTYYSDKNVEIQYFKQNPVGKLYERLGFVDNGETEFHYQMIKRV